MAEQRVRNTRQPAGLVESPVRLAVHAGFGRRAGHRRDEALCAYFVEGLTYAQAGEPFGYTRWTHPRSATHTIRYDFA